MSIVTVFITPATQSQNPPSKPPNWGLPDHEALCDRGLFRATSALQILGGLGEVFAEAYPNPRPYKPYMPINPKPQCVPYEFGMLIRSLGLEDVAGQGRLRMHKLYVPNSLNPETPTLNTKSLKPPTP